MDIEETFPPKKISKCCQEDMLESGQCLNCGADGQCSCLMCSDEGRKQISELLTQMFMEGYLEHRKKES
jgi:hypothetical protein